MNRFFAKKAGTIGAVVFLGLAMLSIPASSHHSTAMFDWGRETRLENLTIERWVWTNPHTFIYARDTAGNRWAFEGMSPNHLSRAGWSRRSLAPGETIALTYYPLRDGRRGGFNVRVFREGGETLQQLPSAM
ncbi:hypothetical protein GRI62_13280 [Erythrobacter arachoides]|uniref:Uncharacterized protein n=1 Tax=Aurantiacibacter arachoides TaxID=1850444 RepID=A0A845A4G9_9SPHN|nr:DUF6152 family protein [Aurantiacibacter arachoides]MXO94570.1 hypothetical protein [Aurantiacibacter arachoides]GGD62447.1 hypothetical protein GCM10011411_23360 [Aurantiacibacter arachoides]